MLLVTLVTLVTHLDPKILEVLKMDIGRLGSLESKLVDEEFTKFSRTYSQLAPFQWGLAESKRAFRRESKRV